MLSRKKVLDEFLMTEVNITDKLARNVNVSKFLADAGAMMGRAISLYQDVDPLMLLGGQCPKCSHLPYKRNIWLFRHLRDKH